MEWLYWLVLTTACIIGLVVGIGVGWATWTADDTYNKRK